MATNEELVALLELERALLVQRLQLERASGMPRWQVWPNRKSNRQGRP